MELMELLKTRRTYRRFLQKPVEQEIVDEILEAARLASSAANKQPLTYILVQEPEKVKAVFELTKWAGYLPPQEGQPKAGEEPVLFIGVVKNLDINRDCDTDAGLAISNMTLAAWNRGVGSCIIGACNKPALSRMFSLTEDQELHSVVAFGYPSHASHITELADPKAEGAVKYYLDENRDYVVPKRRLKDIIKTL